jgi:hypothetical protein
LEKRVFDVRSGEEQRVDKMFMITDINAHPFCSNTEEVGKNRSKSQKPYSHAWGLPCVGI